MKRPNKVLCFRAICYKQLTMINYQFKFFNLIFKNLTLNDSKEKSTFPSFSTSPSVTTLCNHCKTLLLWLNIFLKDIISTKRLFFWFLVYFGKYGPCTIVHIMTQSCKPSYIKLFKAFYSKAPHPMVKKFFKIWWFDMIQLMILDKMRSCLWKVEQGFWVYGLIKLSDPLAEI